MASAIQLPDIEDNTVSEPLEKRFHSSPPTPPLHMHPSSSASDDDDDCFSVQLDGSEMSPRAPKVSFAICFDEGTESTLRRPSSGRDSP